MKPSDMKRKFVLEYLYEHNSDLSLERFKQLFVKTKQQGYSDLEIEKLIQQMGNDGSNEGLLQVSFPLDMFGNGTLNISLATGWLSLKGEDYLDNLNHPEETPTTINQTFQVTNNGNASFGNNNQNSFTDNHSTSEINAQVDKLLAYKSKFESPTDQANLEQLANSLQEILLSDKKPEPGVLKKLGGFLNKTWTTIQPVAAPLLVQLAMKGYFS